MTPAVKNLLQPLIFAVPIHKRTAVTEKVQCIECGACFHWTEVRGRASCPSCKAREPRCAERGEP